MFHYYESITNTSGDSLAGYFARVLDTGSGEAIPLYADNSGTPIVTVSGQADMAVTDSAGNLSFYLDPGTYNLDLYAPDAVSFIRRVPHVGMTSTQGIQGPPGPSGPAGNVAATLDELKAALITNDTMIYDHATFKWTESDYTGQADDTNIIKSDANDLSVGAWVRQGAASIAAIALGTGSVIRTQASKNSDLYSVFDTIPAAEHAAIMAGTSTYDATADIQQAIDNAVSLGKDLYVPGGLYTVAPIDTFTAEGGTCHRCFAIRSGMHIRADKRAIFRIKDGVSTDDAPLFMCMFGTNETLTDVSWSGLTLDMNGAGNPINPNRDSGVYSRLNQAPIFVSGTPAGIAARISNVTVEGCAFLNIPGVSAVCMAQSNSDGVDLGRFWTVRNCLFENVGIDTDDFSAIYAWADDVVCEGNVFRNSTPYGAIGTTGGNTAYEIHGARQIFRSNVVENFLQGLWSAANRSTAAYGNIISNNVFKTVFNGISFYREVVSEADVYDTLIDGNYFYFDDTAVEAIPGLDLKRCVDVSASYVVSRVKVTNNHAFKTGTSVASAFMTVSGGLEGEKHTGIYSHGNSASGFSMGTLASAGAGGLGVVSHTDNHWSNLAPAGIHSISTGDFLNSSTQTVDTLILGGGSVSGAQYGAYLSGIATVVHLKKIACDDVTVSNLEASGATITSRHGLWDDVAFTPAWSSGSAISLGNGSVQGSYSISGSLVTMNARLTMGSTTTLPGGTLVLTAPITSDVTGMQYLGVWRIFDSSAGVFKTGVAEMDGSGSSITLQVDGAGNASDSSPVALATDDIVSVQMTYRADA